MIASSRDWLSSLSSFAEIAAVVLTLSGAFSGVVYVLTQRPLREIEAQQKAQLEQKLAETELAAAVANRRAAELEETVAPRRLSQAQANALSHFIRFSGQLVEIESYSNDTEALILATQIAELLRGARVHVLDNRSTLQASGLPAFGIVVSGSDRALVSALQDALRGLLGNPAPQRDNVTTRLSFGARIYRQPTLATILVGAKPPRSLN